MGLNYLLSDSHTDKLGVCRWREKEREREREREGELSLGRAVVHMLVVCLVVLEPPKSPLSLSFHTVEVSATFWSCTRLVALQWMFPFFIFIWHFVVNKTIEVFKNAPAFVFFIFVFFSYFGK